MLKLTTWLKTAIKRHDTVVKLGFPLFQNLFPDSHIKESSKDFAVAFLYLLVRFTFTLCIRNLIKFRCLRSRHGMTNRIKCQRPVQLHYLFGTISYEKKTHKKATLPNRHINNELQTTHLSSQSLNLDGRQGTTDDLSKLTFHFSYLLLP